METFTDGEFIEAIEDAEARGLRLGLEAMRAEMQKALTDALDLRTAQLLATTDEQRDNGDESNPIIYAESGPNRFSLMSLFFSETDGVQIQEDLDLNEITVKFFTDEQETPLTAGPLYDWAVNFYRHNA